MKDLITYLDTTCTWFVWRLDNYNLATKINVVRLVQSLTLPPLSSGVWKRKGDI